MHSSLESPAKFEKSVKSYCRLTFGLKGLTVKTNRRTRNFIIKFNNLRSSFLVTAIFDIYLKLHSFDLKLNFLGKMLLI